MDGQKKSIEPDTGIIFDLASLKEINFNITNAIHLEDNPFSVLEHFHEDHTHHYGLIVNGMEQQIPDVDKRDATKRMYDHLEKGWVWWILEILSIRTKQMVVLSCKTPGSIMKVHSELVQGQIEDYVCGLAGRSL